MVVFLRRNEKFFTIKYVKTTGLVSMEGVALAPSNAKKLFDMGLNSQGQIRVKTDANVISHNATKIRDKNKAKKMGITSLTMQGRSGRAPENEGNHRGGSSGG